MDFYILGLVCLISRVDIRTDIQSEVNFEMLAETLTHARPKELRVESTAMRILHAEPGSPSSLLRGAPGSRLENLLLRIDLSSSDGKRDIAAALEGFGSSLGTCPLRRLRLSECRHARTNANVIAIAAVPYTRASNGCGTLLPR
ncbi:hypothetical protein C8Q80DRAFT_757525 [Daedaleopsis nitida]|nr:hypothetical protein C8Q80DRAFT_757525 [Daedaleopsis nitida]